MRKARYVSFGSPKVRAHDGAEAGEVRAAHVGRFRGQRLGLQIDLVVFIETDANRAPSTPTASTFEYCGSLAGSARRHAPVQAGRFIRRRCRWPACVRMPKRGSTGVMQLHVEEHVRLEIRVADTESMKPQFLKTVADCITPAMRAIQLVVWALAPCAAGSGVFAQDIHRALRRRRSSSRTKRGCSGIIPPRNSPARSAPSPAC